MEKIVYVVHCIDTEGPLYESLDATFERINDIFRLILNLQRNYLKSFRKRKLIWVVKKMRYTM